MESKVKAIEIALENELRERDFYLRHAEKTDNPVGKEMFTKIAAEEDEHYERLKAIHEKLEGEGVWPEEISEVVNETNIRQVLKDLPKLADKTFKSTADDLEAIKIAIDFEKEAYEHYTKLKNEAGNSKEKSFFTSLADIEWEHVLSLQDTLEYFEDPQAWYAKNEKSQLDG